ncbi:hypothetical protein [Nocardioides sp. MH1]|uniref:hypothetical protein n=1 Tax=Nocardioides sp. MH1 TaxID=3242490 RepID=UPI003520154F
MLATVPTFPATRPGVRRDARPTSGEALATWTAIVLVLLAFWYGVGVGVAALWGHFAA